jgi:hypothetical protein
VEVETGHADGGDRLRPGGHLVEVAAPYRAALDAREDQCARFVLDVPAAGKSGESRSPFPEP